MKSWRELAEVGRAFLQLGLTSFGGPVAHLGYFRKEFVERRRWLDDEAYADVVALSQFLPGPASSQVAFALGMLRAGWLGGVVASLGFTLPSAVLMIAFAYGVVAAGDLSAAGWVHGLKVAAVGVVAQAVWAMGRRLCPDRSRLIIALAAAALLVLLPSALAQVGVIVAGGVAGYGLFRGRGVVPAMGQGSAADWRQHLVAGATLGMFLVLLVLLPILTSAGGWRVVAEFDSFYRAGALVFGGGHVILPLLRAEVVPTGWVADSDFLAGYGAAQAVPGPLFTFAGYLGTLMHGGPHAWLGGVWCLVAIFLPAWLLIAGAYPFWHALRSTGWASAALRGANAAVVGVLLAALYNPVWTEGVRNAADAVTAFCAFVLLQWAKAPPWLVVLLAAAAGAWLLGG